MNVHVQRTASPSAQGAEGLPRRQWTIADIERMQEAEIIERRERFELIGGEIVPMAPKGAAHETVKKELNKFWAKALPAGIDMVTGTTLHISSHDFLEPDFIFWPQAVPLKDVRAEHILLLVEVADSSLSYDLGRRAQIYASLGILEYWAIDAVRRATHIHRAITAQSQFAAAAIEPFTQRLTPFLVPALAVCLADIGLGPMTSGPMP
jgi:Uma2 family endonuclease